MASGFHPHGCKMAAAAPVISCFQKWRRGKGRGIEPYLHNTCTLFLEREVRRGSCSHTLGLDWVMWTTLFSRETWNLGNSISEVRKAREKGLEEVVSLFPQSLPHLLWTNQQISKMQRTKNHGVHILTNPDIADVNKSGSETETKQTRNH